MPILHTALHSEAKIFKEEFSLRKVRSLRKIEIFARDNIVLVVSGVGKIPTSIGVSLASELFPTAQDLYLNLGIAGSSSKQIPLGEIRLLNKVVDLATHRSYFPDCLLESSIEASSLGTSELPVVHKPAEGLNSSFSWNPAISKFSPPSNPSLDLYDMEASSFFQSAIYFTQTHRIHSLKIVSDYLEGSFCKAGDVEEWMKGNKDTIFTFIESQRNFFLAQESDSHFEKDDSILQEIRSNLRLTVSQMVDVTKAFEYWKFHAKVDDGEWRKFLYSNSDRVNKAEGKHRMKEIISTFYNRKK